MPPSPVLLVVTAVATALLATACGPGRGPESPRDVLSEYARALSDGRARDAYKLLSDDARKGMPFEAFERIVKENPEETKAIATALSRPSSSATVTATVTTQEGETLLLLYEGNAWRVDRSAIDWYGQDTPEVALRSFVRAVRSKRYDVLMRFVPDGKREGLDPAKLKAAFEGEQKNDMERLTAAIDAALPTAAVEHIGERATMSYGSGGTVEMVREHGIWKVEEF